MSTYHTNVYFSPVTQIVCFSGQIAECCSKINNDETIDMDLMSQMEVIFKSQACFNASFLENKTGNFSCTSKYSGIDVAEAEKAFSCIAKLENDTLKQIVSEIRFGDGYDARKFNLFPPNVSVFSLRYGTVLRST